jgi:hypothetical protein
MQVKIIGSMAKDAVVPVINHFGILVMVLERTKLTTSSFAHLDSTQQNVKLKVFVTLLIVLRVMEMQQRVKEEYGVNKKIVNTIEKKPYTT